MKKVISVLLALVVGFLLFYYVINQYQNKQALSPVFSEQESAYFIQYGVYSSMESMQKNTLNLTDYIYSVIDNKYYVYLAITKDEDVLDKLKGYYGDLGYNIYVKSLSITSKEFIETLNQFDLILKETSEKEVIKSTCSLVLTKYEELMMS
ncbi:MAG: hypothetical protein PHE54_01695 [Bacilli bacterium]|nr:hypothetical protein [Bacilli bacterium]